MFKVMNKRDNDIVRTVYSVDEVGGKLYFLVYIGGDWNWIVASNYEPVEEGNTI